MSTDTATTTGPGDEVSFVLLDRATGRRIDGATLSDLVDGLIDGHAAADAEHQLELRLEALANAAAIAQAVGMGDADLDDYDEDTLTVLLHDRLATVVAFAEWEGDTPLYLLTTSYAPFSDTPAPVGDGIVWLDPSTERTFLEALVATGTVEVYSREAA